MKTLTRKKHFFLESVFVQWKILACQPVTFGENFGFVEILEYLFFFAHFQESI